MKIRFITSLLLILITPAFAAPGISGATNTTNQITASGTVKDSETKEPLIGANVVALDSANKELKTNNGNLIGDSADADGKFKFTKQIPTGSKLRISHIGYDTQTVSAGSNLNILMNPAKIALDEVEVDGTKTDHTCVDKVATTPANEETTIEETVITPDNEDGTVATECTPDSTNPECDCPDDKIREVDNTCVDETALYKQAKAEMMNRHTQLTTQTEQLNNSEAQ